MAIIVEETVFLFQTQKPQPTTLLLRHHRRQNALMCLRKCAAIKPTVDNEAKLVPGREMPKVHTNYTAHICIVVHVATYYLGAFALHFLRIALDFYGDNAAHK